MPRSSTSARSQRARGRLGRDSSPEPLRVARADGSYLYDEDGKRYIDLTSGWCVGNLGWGPRELRDALAEYDGPDYVAAHFEYAPWEQLAEELCALAPGRMERAFRATGGSEAVDLALQAAMIATGRTKVVALDGCYHGNTLATLAVSGEAPKGMRPGARRIHPPFGEKALARLETALRRKDVAAVILEPIAISPGVEVPEPEFMAGLEQVCKESETLLIADEVATGFGRTGALFASEHFDLDPDMVCLAKGITGGVMPMGALLMTKDVAKAIEDDFSGYSTYGWHPRSTHVALANLAYWRKQGKSILRNVAARSDQAQARLEEMPWEGDVEVHVKGLAIAVHLEDEAYAKKVGKAARKRGVLVAPSEDVLQLFPPLTIDERTLDAGLDALEAAL